MTKSDFWNLIAKIDCDALEAGDEEGAVEPLIEALATHIEVEILEFEDTLAKRLYDIDGEDYADQAGESGQSDDGFLYARCYVVANGERYYNSVKSNPTNMPKSIEQWCESLLYVAQQAWAIATNNVEESWDYEAPVSYETGSNKAQWT